MAVELRLYRGPEEFPLRDEPVKQENRISEGSGEVPIRLSDLLSLLSMAQRLNFMWLKDFAEDEVMISADLNDVLQSFQGCRPSA